MTERYVALHKQAQECHDPLGDLYSCKVGSILFSREHKS